jgi:hypothetical protein
MLRDEATLVAKLSTGEGQNRAENRVISSPANTPLPLENANISLIVNEAFPEADICVSFLQRLPKFRAFC